MTNDQEVEEIVLYHGSLDELNSRNPDRQYRLADQESFVHECSNHTNYRDSCEVTRSLLRKEGHDGIVNRRTSHSIRSDHFVKYLIEGTPIVRVQGFPKVDASIFRA